MLYFLSQCFTKQGYAIIASVPATHVKHICKFNPNAANEQRS